MNTINFDEFYYFISDKFKELTNTLYDNNYINNKLNYITFENSGELKHTILDGTKNAVVLNILDSGITRDNDSDLDSYLQDINIELLIEEDDLEDESIVINSFAEIYKSLTTKIDDKAVIIKTSLSHSGFEKKDLLHSEYLSTNINIKIIIYDNYSMTNDYKLYIDNNDVRFNSLSMNRTFETINDGTKTIDAKFFQNTSGQVIAITFPYVENNPAIEKLVKDSAAATNFGEPYTIYFYKDETKPLIGTYNSDLKIDEGKEYIAKNITCTWQWGSIVAIQVQFYRNSNKK